MIKPDSTGMLPLPIRARLIAAAALPKTQRAKAIDDVYVWARFNYPGLFTDAGILEVPIFRSIKK